VWNSSLIDVWATTSFNHTLIIHGRVILSGENIVILNVYAPCETAKCFVGAPDLFCCE